MDEKRNPEESESRRLEGLYRKAADPVLRTHLLMVWRMSLGDSVGEVAKMVGYSKKWIPRSRGATSQEVSELLETSVTLILVPKKGLCSMRPGKRSY